jgi:signal transduction histidine kinase
LISDTGRSNIKIEKDVEPENLCINADEELMIRVLLNLIKNSIESVEDGNDTEISLAAGQLKNGRTQIRLNDNGPGMDELVMERIFVPFFTTKENGNGIGLSLSRQIINMHKGSISVQSAPGKGTTITLVI